MNTEQFFRVMKGFFPSPSMSIGVAVSGGSDSMFLACNLSLWGKRYGVAVVPLIVNHGLRPSAHQEAERVAQWMRSMEMHPHILSGVLSCGTSGIQEKARRFRYGLLSAAGHHLGISHIFLGHQKDDLLETVLMREEAQSTWRGLAGMSSIIQRHGIKWVRPLLSFSRGELQTWLVEHGIPWIHDPSNDQDHFTRVRVRKTLSIMDHRKKEALYERTCAYARRRQEESLFLARTISSTHAPGCLRVPFLEVQKIMTAQVAPWVMQNWIYSLTAGKRPVKTCSLAHAWAVIGDRWKKEKSGVLATVGGALWIRHHDDLFVMREAPRTSPLVLEGWIQRSDTEKDPLPLWWDYRLLCRPAPWEEESQEPSLPLWLHRLWSKTFPWEDVWANLYKKHVVCAPAQPVFYGVSGTPTLMISQ